MFLHDLPDDVLLHIFSFLPSRKQILTVPVVCQRFNLLISTQWYWRGRFIQLCGVQPVRELPTITLWQEACVQREFALGAARNSTTQRLLSGALGEIDSVHILRSDMYGASTIVAAGARDSTVYVWRKRPSSSEARGSPNQRRMREFTMATLNGHKGWVWSLISERDYRPQLLCSGSWDRSIKVWDVSVGECAATIDRVHKAAVLSLCIPQRDTLISACFDKKVRVFDLRQPPSVQAEHTLHKRSVLSVVASEEYVYSSSEDASVCVWDQRNRKMLQRIKLPGIVPALHLDHGILSVGTSSAVTVEGEGEGKEQRHHLYMYRCSGGNLQEIEHFDTGHSQPITCVYHSLGLLATGSKDGCVHLYTPGAPPTLCTVLGGNKYAITSLDVYRNCLATADKDVNIWTL